MNIWVLQIGEPLPLDPRNRKMRTSLVVDELVRRGHSVTWWASTFEHQRKKRIFDRETVVTRPDGLRIIALNGMGYRNNVSIRRYCDHRFIAKSFSKRCRFESVPDVIVTALPCHHLAYMAARYAVEKGIPYAVDIRDLWPDIFFSRVSGLGLKALSWLLKEDVRRAKYSLQAANALFAVSKGYLDWGLRQACREQCPGDEIFYHGYIQQNDSSSKSVRPHVQELLSTCP